MRVLYSNKYMKCMYKVYMQDAFGYDFRYGYFYRDNSGEEYLVDNLNSDCMLGTSFVPFSFFKGIGFKIIKINVNDFFNKNAFII